MQRIVVCLVGLAAAAAALAPGVWGEDPVSLAPLFVLDNGTHGPNLPTRDSEAAMVAEVGFRGIAPSGTAGIPEMLAAYDAHGLAMTALYVGASVDPDEPAYDPSLPEVIRLLKGRDTIIWLYLQSKKYPASSDAGDERAVAVVREIGELAARSGLKVALYPHTWFYVQRVEDALRVADKVDLPNVGVTFNLCHWLRVDGPTDLRARLERALPRLMVVTINGADTEGDWDRLIQTLDRGSYDVFGLLKLLRDLGYRGPVGLQCYGIQGDPRENLTRSMQAWRAYQARLAKE
jgi:sugar phosphate isomerase/epimerase